MSLHDEIIDALTSLYQQILRHPYLEAIDIKIPPESGWNTIDTKSLHELGKNQTVIELLKRLPYLESSTQYERLLIGYETAAIAYTQKSKSFMEEVTPLPSDCVFLTEGIDREGYSLILDTKNGKSIRSTSTLITVNILLTIYHSHHHSIQYIWLRNRTRRPVGLR